MTTYGPKTKITKRTISRLRRNAQELAILEQRLFAERYVAASEHAASAARYLIAASNIVEAGLSLRAFTQNRGEHIEETWT